ncbi:ATP synthase F0 subcomplex A subunit [Nocardioides exalbidus]|uniref:ATP synthase subunit a n=1 Tax=Nocardioides exalbidus TaxID=402596 RepID=A0A1H4VCY7_9ACTN|nr:F0F1 ATP synthase subunit A [Nocardioides exalbidus]SEC78244.1 ATP synthase F0 subcomplex A subunit [Nocardioides exalbidus]
MFGITMAASGDEFVAPGPNSFDFSKQALFHIGDIAVTKPMVQLLLGAVIVFGFFWIAFRRPQLVPGRMQFAGESAYGMVRNSIGRDIIGSHDFIKFVPYLVTIFFFLLINNVMASIPAIQFPTFSRASMAYALAALSWIIYNAVGIKKHGLLGYLKLQSVPSGVSPAMYPLLVPLEFFSNILVRPVTLALRLFANMFAGHLLMILFTTGGLFLLQYGGIGYVAGPAAWLLAIAIGFLELLVQFLQAYVFTLLNAMYISGALADEH